MRKSKNKKKARDKADKYYSLYIRQRDSDENGFGPCITCEKVVHINEADCGHFVLRDRGPTRYDERNSNLQCRACNRFKNGLQYEHGKAIDLKFGPGTADELVTLGRGTQKSTQDYYEEVAQKYKELLDE